MPKAHLMVNLYSDLQDNSLQDNRKFISWAIKHE